MLFYRHALVSTGHLRFAGDDTKADHPGEHQKGDAIKILIRVDGEVDEREQQHECTPNPCDRADGPPMHELVDARPHQDHGAA